MTWRPVSPREEVNVLVVQHLTEERQEGALADVPADRLTEAKDNCQSHLVRNILRPCSRPGCASLAPGKTCEEHRGEQDRHRGSSASRGYDSDWRKLRAVKLAHDPICEIRTHCLGYVASEVDHKIPIRDWPEGRLDWSNLQSTCRPCHSAKTVQERTRAVMPRGRSENIGATRAYQPGGS